MELSPEFDLVARCCRWNFPRGGGVPATDEALDWPLVLRLARFHRVQGLVHRALDGSPLVPDDIRQALAEDAARIAAANLEAAVESRRLLTAFAAAGVPLLFVKGLTLGALAYGSAASKAAIDIDLVIAPANLGKAAELLNGLGYSVTTPANAGVEALTRWHSVSKESAWSRAGSASAVDLHTSLADNPQLLAGIDADAPPAMVDIGNGIALPTLGLDALFPYLAVHGASSAWFRLKWISDFAALCSTFGATELARLYRRAEQACAGRAAGQALLLADGLFETLAALPDLKRDLDGDPAIRRLHRAALRQLAGRREPAEPTETPMGTLTIHRTQFALQRGLGFKWSEFVRQARVALSN